MSGGGDVGTEDEAKIAIHYVEEWLKRVEKKIDAHDERFGRIEKRVGQLVEAGYVAREKYDADLKEQQAACANRHAPITVAIDKINLQQHLWTGNAQIVRWFVMVAGAAVIVSVLNRIPWLSP